MTDPNSPYTTVGAEAVHGSAGAASVAPEWAPPEALHRGQPVAVDTRFGHITCGELVFCDMGSILHAWSWCGDEIEPERARTLGEALIAWADRKLAEQHV